LAKLEATVEAQAKIIKAVEVYEKECTNPAPDLAYRRVLRDALFKTLRGEGGE